MPDRAGSRGDGTATPAPAKGRAIAAIRPPAGERVKTGSGGWWVSLSVRGVPHLRDAVAIEPFEKLSAGTMQLNL